ncbi:hypothetical protein ASE01_19070 [Nocardioides sp. Root190]|uniref:M48 family metallopeptidase n=1 Tax=Nocardioides sp. Root190 TaxID=1736488 RepID=UPI0006FBA662|nr:M48 family metallopeptidase [Nocardioides sp. Root190]KRB74091.1 hypothetical protein ASE01_19070 [Nocardioides sp. Root190]
MPPTTTFAQRLDARVAEAVDRRVVDRVASGGRRSLALALVVALVTPVHLLSVALLLGAGALLVRGDGWWQWSIAAFLLLLAWVTRPHLVHRMDPDVLWVDPADAPTLVALVEEVSALAGCRPPARIGVDADLNASVGPLGIRSRRLVLGAPLWVALGPQERVALLGHEIGHIAHGDLLGGQYVGGACRTLDHWVHLMAPDEWDSLVVHAVFAPPRWLVQGYLRLLLALNSTASRRQELHADVASALTGGTAAAVSGLEMLLITDGIDVAANRAAIARDVDLATAIRERVTAFGAAQRASAREQGREDRRSIDATHPPTTDRLRLLESIEPSPAAVVLDGDRNRRIDAEISRHLEKAFRELGEHYRYVH